MQQLQGQHGVNLGRIVAATLQVTVDHRLEAFSFDVRPGQRARIQEHVANVSGQDIAVPDAEVMELVPAEEEPFEVLAELASQAAVETKKLHAGKPGAAGDAVNVTAG